MRDSEKKQLGVTEHGTRWGGMCKCKTKTFVQVCIGADREEMESGPSKTAAQRRFCWVRPDCLNWEVKQEPYLEVRNAKHR